MSRFDLTQETQTSIEIKVLGGYIYIDGTDIELPRKFANLMKEVEEGEKRMKQEELLLKKKNLSENKHQEALIDIMLKFINQTYKGINALFGEGSTDKIFRVKSLASLRHFIENITPIFEELSLDTQSYYDDYIKEAKDSGKYAPLDAPQDEIKDLG